MREERSKEKREDEIVKERKRLRRGKKRKIRMKGGQNLPI